jgi:hypothetical protein
MAFTKNLSIMGGFLLLHSTGAKQYSVDALCGVAAPQRICVFSLKSQLELESSRTSLFRLAMTVSCSYPALVPTRANGATALAFLIHPLLPV